MDRQRKAELRKHELQARQITQEAADRAAEAAARQREAVVYRERVEAMSLELHRAQNAALDAQVALANAEKQAERDVAALKGESKWAALRSHRRREPSAAVKRLTPAALELKANAELIQARFDELQAHAPEAQEEAPRVRVGCTRCQHVPGDARSAGFQI